MKKRSKHSLSHYKLLTCKMGQLVPVSLVEVLPGDTLQHATAALLRSSPLNTPVMHPVRIRFHHWYVPNRLVWDDWEKFITGGPDGMDASVFPTISTGAGFAQGSLADYLGVKPGVASQNVSALPFRAYAKIVNDWYADQDLVTPLALSTASGSDSTTNTSLFNVAWEKDYFTTARPFTQKGPAVTLPLGTKAPIAHDGTNADRVLVKAPNIGTSEYPMKATTTYVEADNTGAGPGFPLYADLSEATAATINQLRLASALQRYEEARARYGSRYTEYLAYLGVKASDARLQRPEYLGGGKNTMQFSEVLQTAGTSVDSSDGVGNMLGHGIGTVRSNRYRKYFEEHGYVITLMSVLPKTIYADGLPRTWNRRAKEDFWQQELQHIGQQAIKYKEVKLDHATPEGTFGWQDHYDDYRRMESSIAGEFRTTLNTWHYARLFGTDPELNSSFITSNPTTRVNQDTSGDTLYCMVNHSIQARRLIAQVGTSYLK